MSYSSRGSPETSILPKQITHGRRVAPPAISTQVEC
jgi:hypothetical protein